MKSRIVYELGILFLLVVTSFTLEYSYNITECQNGEVFNRTDILTHKSLIDRKIVLFTEQARICLYIVRLDFTYCDLNQQSLSEPTPFICSNSHTLESSVR